MGATREVARASGQFVASALTRVTLAFSTLPRDFYRKIPRDMTEGTIPGSVISTAAAVMIAVLLAGAYTRPLHSST
jgi:hypothetical protein